MLPPFFREKKNNEGFTPRELFSEYHTDLSSKAEEWSKEIATQLMVVGALVATITFAAAITFPGGYNQDNDSPSKGSPMLLSKGLFTSFVLLCAISSTHSCASIVAALSILTSSFGEEDLLLILSEKMTIAIGSLYFSIITMLMAFGTNFFILYESKKKTIPVIVIFLTYVPVIYLVGFMQPVLMWYVIDSYTNKSFTFNRKKRTLKTH